MLPYLAKIGTIPIHTMAVFWCLGYLTGAILVIVLARREGLSMGKALNLMALSIAASVIGGKVSAVLLLTSPNQLTWFARHPAEILKIWEPGFSFYGVVVFATLAGLWYTLRSGLPVYRTADIFIPGAALGHAVQSVGDFLAGAHPGIPTGLPWGVVFSNPAFRGISNVPLHPVMLYIAALSSVGVLTAYGWLQVRKGREKFFLSFIFYPAFRVFRFRFFGGEMFFLSGAFYACFRFFVEFFRDPRTLIWYPNCPLPQTQVACLVFFILCWGWYFALRAIWETEQKGLPYRGWMKLCFRLAEVVRWLSKRVPWPMAEKR